MRRNPTAAAGVTVPVHRIAESPTRPIIIDTGRQAPAPETAPTPRRGTGAAAVLKAYVALTKPRIVELLLITTVPAMLLAARKATGGLPEVWTVVAVVIGGALAAGSANALNCFLDRDIDQLMRRTSRRPLPQHTVSPRSALVFGLVLGVVSVTAIGLVTNLLAAGLTLAAIAYYDLIYTLWLKRTTAANTVWGGVCGAAPVLIGWAAVTGGLSWEAWILFAVVFFWQPPHFWALAVKYKDDYAAAGIPMLPVVASARRVGLESVIYAWLTLVSSLALWPLATTPLYGIVAAATGLMFCVEAHRMHGRARRDEDLKPMRLFHWSTSYLTLLFVALAVDSFLI
ncbi:heme o synthase [Stackebrandtia nassauensis]|uniref:Protoheme IX farnesyltransferase n=1 Tax=Stackebrandtia nassauensis (strain DSM 44728 / CIP 108903 / NRRL B-16338 / NBRC 102104 / LLR-40K-21) TaxID=446470 RepID=D3Q4S6_STANL|nr:heme o synthase [Stackebrandtia nassauensis]ADD42106.1 protoheme IX farnesyltransferase [Stackebrandtia nassauensis DSM 44728]